MLIAVVSDSHDRADLLANAVGEARAAGAEAVVHCGDVIGAQTLRPLEAFGLPVHVVHGNNLGDPHAMSAVCAATNGLIRYHGQDAELTLGGRRLFVTHLPRYARAFACTGDFDLVCCGHDHRAYTEQVANAAGRRTWLVNPGTVAGLAACATWLLADLEELRFEVREMNPASAASIST